jgi:hypothetical protein
VPASLEIGKNIACTRQLALLAVEAWVVDITLSTAR